MDINITSSQKELSQRRLEEYDRYCKIINCGRKNPIWFAEEFFGLKLMDYQKMVFYEFLDNSILLLAKFSWRR